MKKITIIFLALLAILSSCANADDEQMQRNSQSWMGLTGLYVVPTARVIGKDNLAFTFSEPKHVEYVPTKNVRERYMDRQVGQALTYGVTENFEIYARRNRNLYDQGNKARLNNSTFYDYGFKWQFRPEDVENDIPAIALAIRGLGAGRDVSGILDVRNGRIGFLLATKRVAKNPESQNFTDFTVGVGLNYHKASFMFGMECAVTPTVSLIAEGMTNAPFLNFRDYTAAGNVAGRFIYDTGIRFYPDSVPGMVVDLGFVGDGAFEFSFGWGYVMHL